MSGATSPPPNLEALAESASAVGAAVDELPHLIWMSDPEGRLTFSNKVVYDYVGDNLDAATSAQHWIMLVHTEDRDGFIQVFRENVQARRPFHATCRVQRKDGAWRWIETRAHARFNAEGAFLGHVGASVDITEHRNAPPVQALSASSSRKT